MAKEARLDPILKGIRSAVFFDTADVYGGTLSELYLGKALEGHRNGVRIATKFGVPIDDTHTGGASASYLPVSTPRASGL